MQLNLAILLEEIKRYMNKLNLKQCDLSKFSKNFHFFTFFFKKTSQIIILYYNKYANI